MIYICSPYSDPDPYTRHDRYETVLRYTAHCIKQSEHVFSPIVHCHMMAVRYDLPKDFNFWKDYNHSMIDACRTLRILTLPGWEESKGVQAEIQYANLSEYPIAHIQEDPAKW